jgi:Arc/MetJ-type ribon-helix-helix transcriptional regulator
MIQLDSKQIPGQTPLRGQPTMKTAAKTPKLPKPDQPPEVRGLRAGETEKMAVNMGVVDLGHVDLLVQEGFYSNRSDMVRTAVRNLLAMHADVLKQTVARRTLTLGLQHYSRADLERVVAASERLHIEVVGLARIADDVPAELAVAAIESVSVLGAFQASPAVRRALAHRIK